MREMFSGYEARKTRARLSIMFFSWLFWMGMTASCMASAINEEALSVSAGGFIFIAGYLAPYFIIGALYGYVASLASFTLTFITVLIVNMTEAYTMSVYLVVVICSSLFAQYFWFETKKKTFIAATVTVISTSFIELLSSVIVANNAYHWEQLLHYGKFVFRDGIAIYAIAFAIHLFFTKAPDMCKMVFPIGIGYTKAYKENKEIQRNLRKTRVSLKITAIIFSVELVLGIFVAIFTVALFPDLKDMMVGSFDNSDVFSGMTGSAGIQNIRERIEQVGFTLNDSAIGYDIKMILMMLCVGVPMAAFANFYAKMTIGGPLGVMSDFMYEFANADDDNKIEVGRKVDRIVVKTHDEIEILHESMQSTVHSIEDYIGRIKAEQELEKELEVAQKASEAKSSFLSNMSHEIRTPINAVLGMNEMIMRECNDEQILEYAANVKSAGNSLLGIVNDILDFSKIEAGKMDILPVQYHIGSTINDLINMISTKAADKGLELNIEVDENLPTTLFGDEVRIKQVITNILTNAVKYTEHGSVTLRIGYNRIDDDNIKLAVQVVDTGIGIREEDLGKLFSPFERIEEIRNRTIEGTGLGMSIVKKLLALMDTKLVVKSVYGEGSDFSFEVEQKVVSWEPIGDFKQKYKEYILSTEKYHERFHAPDAQILVVDDTAMNLTVIKGLLKNTQIKVDTADSGKETLVKVTEKRYDAIFIDHRMPEMDGIETLAAMKTLEGNLNVGVPCIALTANAVSGARDEYIAAGFDDYLSKPVNGLILEDMLKEYLPDDKIVPEDGGGGENAAADGTVSNDSGKSEGNSETSMLDALKGIDLKEAEKNCGSREVLEDVVKEFYISIGGKADNIEQFAADKDYRNYTVAVHALKSSARLIGAMELSGQAAYLEQCGNEENESEITEKTPALLELYRSYKDNLAACAQDDADNDKPEIDAEEFIGAVADMKELIEAYDFDTADGIMKMLEDYRIPDGHKEKYDKIRQLMAAVDRDALLEIL